MRAWRGTHPGIHLRQSIASGVLRRVPSNVRGPGGPQCRCRRAPVSAVTTRKRGQRPSAGLRSSAISTSHAAVATCPERAARRRVPLRHAARAGRARGPAGFRSAIRTSDAAGGPAPTRLQCDGRERVRLGRLRHAHRVRRAAAADPSVAAGPRTDRAEPAPRAPFRAGTRPAPVADAAPNPHEPDGRPALRRPQIRSDSGATRRSRGPTGRRVRRARSFGSCSFEQVGPARGRRAWRLAGSAGTVLGSCTRCRYERRRPARLRVVADGHGTSDPGRDVPGRITGEGSDVVVTVGEAGVDGGQWRRGPGSAARVGRRGPDDHCVGSDTGARIAG